MKVAKPDEGRKKTFERQSCLRELVAREPNARDQPANGLESWLQAKPESREAASGCIGGSNAKV